jgi:hypothetical protein
MHSSPSARASLIPAIPAIMASANVQHLVLVMAFSLCSDGQAVLRRLIASLKSAIDGAPVPVADCNCQYHSAAANAPLAPAAKKENE